MRRTLTVVGLSAAVLATTAFPALGADSGVVDAKVVVAAPCISLAFGNPPPLDFGTQAFSTTSKNVLSVNGGMSVTNCSFGAENLLVRATKATNSAGATWDLLANSTLGSAGNLICNVGTNKYWLGVSVNGPNGSIGSVDGVTETSQQLATINYSAAHVITSALQMPCMGSAGAATPMNFQLVYTASL